MQQCDEVFWHNKCITNRLLQNELTCLASSCVSGWLRLPTYIKGRREALKAYQGAPPSDIQYNHFYAVELNFSRALSSMWLINTSTLKLEQFVSEQDTTYAILSHRWQNEEVLFEDMQNLSTCRKAGVKKTKACCELARSNAYTYLWIDTCCIDKKSSAELSEAINSMWRYYRQAAVCYAYLCDVEVDSTHTRFERQFIKSAWFSRCWTLQELIAPAAKNLLFYNVGWYYIGTKTDLKDQITATTGIDTSALLTLRLSEYSIAERMCWAAPRRATRVEDIAYSLMGIFDINMPMLYGEGSRAFVRLQEEILKYTDDETLFAWGLPIPGRESHTADPQWAQGSGLLATAPAAFAGCRDLKPTRLHERQDSLTLTNRGLSGCLMLDKQIVCKGDGYDCVALLNASFKKHAQPEVFVGIFLQRSEKGKSHDTQSRKTYVRVVNQKRVYRNDSGSKKARMFLTRWEGERHKVSKMILAPEQIFVRHKGIVKEHLPTPATGFEVRYAAQTGSVPYWTLIEAPGVSFVQQWKIAKYMSCTTGAFCNLEYWKGVLRNLYIMQLGLTSIGNPYLMILDRKSCKEISTPDNTGLSQASIRSFEYIDISALVGTELIHTIPLGGNWTASQSPSGYSVFVLSGQEQGSFYLQCQPRKNPWTEVDLIFEVGFRLQEATTGDRIWTFSIEQIAMTYTLAAKSEHST